MCGDRKGGMFCPTEPGLRGGRAAGVVVGLEERSWVCGWEEGVVVMVWLLGIGSSREIRLNSICCEAVRQPCPASYCWVPQVVPVAVHGLRAQQYKNGRRSL